MRLPLFILVVSALLQSASGAIDYVVTSDRPSGGVDKCKLTSGGVYTPNGCTLNGARALTIFATATGAFNTDYQQNVINLTRTSGTRNWAYDEPRCEVTHCRSCLAASSGLFTQCWLVIPNGQDISGTFVLEAWGAGGASVGTIDVQLGWPIPPVIRQSTGCPTYLYNRALGCSNGQVVTIWGRNFDHEIDSYNQIGFAYQTYDGDFHSTTLPECTGPDAHEWGYLRCNLTWIPSVRGEFAVTVTTQGMPSIYETTEVTFEVYPITNTSTPTPSASTSTTPTVTGTRTATQTMSRTTTSTPSSTPTPSETSTFSRTATASASATMTPTNTFTYSVSVSPTPSESATPTGTSTPTTTSTMTRTMTYTYTTSSTPSSSETPTPSETSTPSVSSTPTYTSTPTPTRTGSRTATVTDTRTLTSTPSATSSPTRTATSTTSETLTVIPTHTPSVSETGTRTATITPSISSTPTTTYTHTQVPHWSRDTQIVFNMHVDHWTTANRLAFQRIVSKFFSFHLKQNTYNTALAGPWNVEILRIRMGEDEVGHRVPDVSVVHWRLWYIGFGYLHLSAELVVLQAFDHHMQWKLIKLLREEFMDAQDNGLMRISEGSPSKCHQCRYNTAPAVPHHLGKSTYKCEYTVGGQVFPTEADAWEECGVANCGPVFDTYRIGPVGGNTFKDTLSVS